jgi:hypothetical protein
MRVEQHALAVDLGVAHSERMEETKLVAYRHGRIISFSGSDRS